MGACGLFDRGALFAGPAEEAVALAARSELLGPGPDELARALDDCDADAFYAVARRHVLGPLLYARLRALDLLGVLGTDVAINLKRDYAVAAMRATSLAEDLSCVLSEFERVRVTAAPITASALAWTLYPEAGGGPMSDFDLLVAADETDRATDALLGIGYRQSTTDPAVIGFYRSHFHLAPMV